MQRITLSDAATETVVNDAGGVQNFAYEHDQVEKPSSTEKETNILASPNEVNVDFQKKRTLTEKIRCFKKWITGTNFFVYCSHFLSAWGDRMWAFGVGLFLIEIASKSLQLTAIYGLCSAFAYLFFGAIVGDWVDKTPRLRAAQLSLALQNVFVICCAAIVYLHLMYEDYINSQWDGWMTRLSFFLIIVLAILGNLASMARTIAVEKDWIVEICGRDKDMLAQMTSTLRRIDLGTKILAPIATGQIMTYVGIEFGAIFIGGWNLVTVFFEYYLIWKVYQTVPALKKKKDIAKVDEVFEETPEEVELEEKTAKDEDATINKDLKRKDDEAKDSDTEQEDNRSEIGNDQGNNTDQSEDGVEKKDPEKPVEKVSDISEKAVTKNDSDSAKKGDAAGGCKFGKGFITLYKGWRTYLRYNVCNAGIGLAFLYLTVLGFDNITVGYSYSQNISESILGFLMAGAAVIGIIGTFTYPIIRKRVGLERTGLLALTTQILCLTICVMSVWMPGSPFDIYHRSRVSSTTKITTNCTNTSSLGYNVTNSGNVIITNLSINLLSNETMTLGNSSCNTPPGIEEEFSYISIIMLMTGIITARFGLWTADLAITQLFLENVDEKERGVVNGVQQSLNKLMDLLKFAMVVAAPEPELFGVLVVISFGSICVGAMMYASYSRKARGHLFHFNKMLHCGNNNSEPSRNPAV